MQSLSVYQWPGPVREQPHGVLVKFDMTADDFREIAAPPTELPPALVALWHDAKGDWDAAHRVAQGVEDESGAWVHAYLHRKEGDAENARYWYARAGRPAASGNFEDEWKAIVVALLTP